jgi:hypothetical protein
MGFGAHFVPRRKPIRRAGWDWASFLPWFLFALVPFSMGFLTGMHPFFGGLDLYHRLLTAGLDLYRHLLTAGLVLYRRLLTAGLVLLLWHCVWRGILLWGFVL